jgi:hypothetical protein
MNRVAIPAEESLDAKIPVKLLGKKSAARVL